MGFRPLNGHMTERNTIPIDIWNFQDALTRRLAWWSIGSFLTGIWMVWGVPLVQDGPSLRVAYNPLAEYYRGMGVQFLAWGAIDLAIALFGAWGTRRRRAKLTPDEIFSTQTKECANRSAERSRRSLAKILWINTGLDVFYIIGGLALVYTLGASDPFWLGGGWGIIIQGGFLFFFDLFHALKLR